MSTNGIDERSDPAAVRLLPTVATSSTLTSLSTQVVGGTDPPSGSDETMEESTIGTTTIRNKRPSDASDTGVELSEKKLRRLEKNRLSARECRRRKREATENMERQINILEGENLRLRLQLQIGEEAEDSTSREQSKLTADIDELLKSGASEVEIYATLEEFKEKYADYGKSRRSAIEFHLRNLERLLMPTQVTSVVMTAMQGGEQAVATLSTTSNNADTVNPAEATTSPHDVSDVPVVSVETVAQTTELDLKPAAIPSSTFGDEGEATSVESVAHVYSPVSPSTITSAEETAATFFGGNGNSGELSQLHASQKSGPEIPWTSSHQQVPNLEQPKSLFQYLVHHLEVTPQQAAALKDSRFVAQELDGCLDSALKVLQELRVRLATTTDNLDSEFNHVRSILTPTQAAKFLVWVANNKACMHMLNELWDRVYAVTPSATDKSLNSAPTPAVAERQLSNGDDDDD